jgi:hypothetical protein
MFKRSAIYPFLFVIYLVLNPLAYNLDQISPAEALRPLVILLSLTLAGILLLYVFVRDWQHAGYLMFIALVFFFMYGHINRLIQNWLLLQNKELLSMLLLLVWGILLYFLGLRILWGRFGRKEWFTPLFNLILAVALVGPASAASIQLFNSSHGSRTLPDTSLAEDLDSQKLDCTNSPDIYFIVLDAYGRSDIIQDFYGVDNGPFLDYLRSKGFYVVDHAYTNYIQTVYSIPAALNFQFINPPPPGIEGTDYFSGLVSDNRIMRLLKQCGYQTVAFETGFYFTNHPEVDLFLSTNSKLNEFESVLLEDSPVEYLVDGLNGPVSEDDYQRHRDRVRYTFNQLASLPNMPGPKIVFAHIVSPHPPFVFAANGELVEPPRSFSMNDGSDYEGGLQEYRSGYAGQVQFDNQMLEKVIDALLANTSKPPVIIIQGDHGPGSLLNWHSPRRTCLWERTGILNAYYLPKEGLGRLYPEITPVNSFRVVLNTYFGTNLQMLPNHTYFTSHLLDRQEIDITETRDSKRNCGITP